MERGVEATPARRSAAIAPPLRMFLELQIMLVLGCAAAEVYAKFVLHLTGIYTYPLRTRGQTAWDFTLFAEQFRYFHQPQFFVVREFPYPAPVAAAYAIFFSYHAHPLRHFLGFILVSAVIAGVGLVLALRRHGLSALKAIAFVAASLLLAYPLWFELKQGNMEICVWVLVAVGVWAFWSGNDYTAAACFGIAGSMKIFPFVYLGLLLARRSYRGLILAGFAAASSTLVSLWLVGPNIVNTWRQLANGIAFFRANYILRYRPDEMGFDHSLFGIYKRFSHPLPPPERLGHIAEAYMAAAAVCGGVVYFVAIRRLPPINQVLCLTLACILLPPLSFDYTLMQLYIPWAMLVLFAQERSEASSKTRQRIRGLIAAFVCMAIAMSPESEFIRHNVRYGGQIKALALVVLMCIGLRYPFARNSESTPAAASE